MTNDPHGVVRYADSSTRRTDYLYRISLKCLIRNHAGEVLVVKEAGRDWWDLPGGGMDHGESIKATIAREMEEEVGMRGEFSFAILAVEEPDLLVHNFWQMRLVFNVTPESMVFIPGEDGDEIAFKDPAVFKNSSRKAERRIYEHSQRTN